MTKTPAPEDLHAMIEQLLDHGAEHHPGIEWHLVISDHWAKEDLPPHEDRVWREVNGRYGYYRGIAIRDTLVDLVPSKWWLVVASALDNPTTYYGDLRTGTFNTEIPVDALVAEQAGTDDLPTFEDMRHRAFVLLSDAEDELRSDWRTGAGPTVEQGQAASDARRLIAQAKAALDKAAR